MTTSLESPPALSSEQTIQEEQYVFPYHYLSLYDPLYERILHRGYLSQLSLANELLDLSAGESVLDAGCGDGRFSYEVKRNHPDVRISGADYSARAIAFAKAFSPNIEFAVRDLSATAASDVFDKVASIEVLEHIPPDQIPDFASNLVKQVKPGGLLVVTVPSVNLPVSPKHYQHFTPARLQEVFAPWCDLVKMVGHLDARRWRKYNRMQRFAVLLWPLRNKLSLARWYISRFDRQFTRIRLVHPDHAAGLAAVFRRR